MGMLIRYEVNFYLMKYIFIYLFRFIIIYLYRFFKLYIRFIVYKFGFVIDKLGIFDNLFIFLIF